MLLLAATATVAGCMRTTVEENRLAFTLPDLEGDSVSLSDEQFTGKVVLVDIWGTWCPPCIEQIPHLVSLQRDYGDSGFEVVAIEFATLDSGTPESYRKGLKNSIEKEGVNYTVLQGGETSDVTKVLPSIRNFRGFPTSIFIGRDGLVRHVKTGFRESEASYYRKTVEALLAEAGPN